MLAPFKKHNKTRLGDERRQHQDWPISTKEMMLKSRVSIEALSVMCFVLPSCLFYDNAEGFFDYNEGPSINRFHIALFQLLLFTSSVIMYRHTKKYQTQGMPPLRIFIECLVDKNDKSTGNRRLWIFETAPEEKGIGTTKQSFDLVHMNAILSDKTVSTDFEFFERSLTRSGPEISSAFSSNSQTTPNSASKNLSTDKPEHVEYKSIGSIGHYACALDCYTGYRKFTAMDQSRIRMEEVSASRVYNPQEALLMTADKGVCAAQSYIGSYGGIGTKNNTFVWHLPFIKVTHEIPFMMLVSPTCPIVETIMTRRFVDMQAEDNKEIYDKHLSREANKLEQKEAMAVIESYKLSKKSGQVYSAAMLKDVQSARASLNRNSGEGDEDDDDSDSDTGYEDASLILDGDDNVVINDFQNANCDYNAFKRPTVREGQGVRVTGKTASGWSQLCNLEQKQQEYDVLRLDDEVSDLKDWFAANKNVLSATYLGENANKQMYNKCMEAQVSILYEQFERRCMSKHSNVSKNQKILNRVFLDENMADRHFLVPITDKHKSLIENQLIYMSAGFTHLENISVLSLLCVFLYLGSNDVFRREFDLHLNFMLSGGNGVGKSHAIACVIEQIVSETVNQMNSSSALADAVDTNTSDELIYSDDYNMASEFKDPTTSANAKSQMSTMVTIRGVLEVKEKQNSKNKREMAVYKSIALRSRWRNKNENMEDIMKTTKGAGESVLALLNRYVNIEVLAYDNEFRSTAKSEEAEKMKTSQQLDARADWRRHNQKFRVIAGWFWKLCSIAPEVMKIDMTAFDKTWQLVIAGFAKSSIVPAHLRVQTQCMRFCQQLVVYDCYLRHHCTESALYYNKTFRISQLKQWDPICFTHHAIIAISFFHASFVASSIAPVLRCIRMMHNDSKDPVYSGQIKASKIEEGQEKLITAITRLAKSKDKDDDEFKDAVLVADNPYGMISPAQKQAVPASSKVEKIEADYVIFNYKRDEFSQLISSRMESMNVKPSLSIIRSVLSSLSTKCISCPGYVIHSPGQKTPFLDDDCAHTTKLAVRFSGDKVHVLTDLVVGTVYGKDAIIKAIENISHSQIEDRDILIGISDDDTPWIYNQVKMRKSANMLVIPNCTYTSDPVMKSLHGRNAREKKTDNQHSHFIKIDTDFDTLAILSYYSASIEAQTISTESMMISHPKNQQKIIMQIENTYESSEDYRYPESFLADLEKQRELNSGKSSALTDAHTLSVLDSTYSNMGDYTDSRKQVQDAIGYMNSNSMFMLETTMDGCEIDRERYIESVNKAKLEIISTRIHTAEELTAAITSIVGDKNEEKKRKDEEYKEQINLLTEQAKQHNSTRTARHTQKKRKVAEDPADIADNDRPIDDLFFQLFNQRKETENKPNE